MWYLNNSDSSDDRSDEINSNGCYDSRDDSSYDLVLPIVSNIVSTIVASLLFL